MELFTSEWVKELLARLHPPGSPDPHLDGHVLSLANDVVAVYLYPDDVSREMVVETWKSEYEYDFRTIGRKALIYAKMRVKSAGEKRHFSLKESPYACEILVSPVPLTYFNSSPKK